MRAIIVLIAVTTAISIGFANSPPDSTPSAVKDSWWGTDKVTHAVVNFTIAGFSAGIARNMLHNTDEGSIAISISVPLGLGLMKEWYDWKHPKHHQASIKDLVAGLVGAIAGTAFVISLSS
jgi:uncharacterized protein YfiM (DUF2279 family)